MSFEKIQFRGVQAKQDGSCAEKIEILRCEVCVFVEPVGRTIEMQDGEKRVGRIEEGNNLVASFISVILRRHILDPQKLRNARKIGVKVEECSDCKWERELQQQLRLYETAPSAQQDLDVWS